MAASIARFAVLGLIAGGLVISGCGDSGSAIQQQMPREQATSVETYRVQSQSFTDRVELTGSVEAIHDATLSAEASGTIETLADRGAFVEKGEVIARLSADDARAAVEQARAQLESARAQLELAEDRYNRQEPLYRDSIISAQEFQAIRSQRAQARASVSQAEAQLSQADQRLQNTKIVAPFSGTIEERFVQMGEQVSPGIQVVRVIDVRPARIVAGVPERYAGEIERGSRVEIDFQTSQIGGVDGKVTFVGSAIDPASRTFPIEATVPNTERIIKPEMVADIRLTRSVLDSVLVIPRVAVLRDESGTDVYVSNTTGGDSLAIARNRPIDLGATYGARAVASAGLEVGDNIIVVGQNNVADGDTVKVLQQYSRIPATGTPFEAVSPSGESGDRAEMSTPTAE